MIKNRLSVLLAERGLKITRVAKDTGISRNTITSTAQNDTEMVRLETVNALCKYLNVTPCEFFLFRPIDLNFTVMISDLTIRLDKEKNRIMFEEIDADLFIDIKTNDKEETIQLNCTIEDAYFNIDVFATQRVVTVGIEFEDEEEKKYFKEEIYNKLDPFYADIYSDIISTMNIALKDSLEESVNQIINQLDPSFDSNDHVVQAMLEDSINDFRVSISSDLFFPF